MPSDPNGAEFTEFQLEEIALGRAQDARRRLAARATREDDPVRTRLAEVREDIERIQDALSAAGDDPDVRIPSDEMLAGYLDESLSNELRVNVERALAGSAEARRRLIEMYQDVRACADGESLPRVALPDDAILPYTAAQPSDRVQSAAPRAILAGGLAGALLFWAGAIYGPEAWQTPLAFAAVTVVAMVLMHTTCASALKSLGIAQRRTMQGSLVLLAVAAVGFGVLDARHMPVACSLVVSALLLLTASASQNNAGIKKSANPEVEKAQTGEGNDVDSRSHGTGGP